MLIIAGKLYVDPELRNEYLTGIECFISRGREAPGCLDFIVAADPVEGGRINLLERWESEETLRAWQARANPPETPVEVLDADVKKYEIASSSPVFE